MHVEESIQIAKPPAEVWAAIADYSLRPRMAQGAGRDDARPAGPAALGTKVREVVRSSGRDYVADTVVTDLDPGSSYRFTGEGTIGKLSGARRVESVSDGTSATFTYEIELQPTAGCACSARCSVRSSAPG